MPSHIGSPHDKLFKAALKNSAVAKEYFETYLPVDLLKAVDLTTLEVCPEIYVDNHLTLTESDIIYKVQVCGGAGYICLAGEHQTQPEVFLPLRILRYNVAIWQFHRDQHPQAKKLPFIINFVFYTGKKPYCYSTDFKDLFEAPRELVDAYWAKPFTLVQVHDIPDEALLQQKWAGLFQYFMKKIRSPDLLDILGPALPKMKAIDVQKGVDYLDAVITYAINTGEISNISDFTDKIRQALSLSTGEKIMTGAEQLIEKGKQEGWQKGRQEGWQKGLQEGTMEGERAILVRLLKRKFIQLSSHHLEKIQQASAQDLLVWADRVLEADTIDDVFSYENH